MWCVGGGSQSAGTTYAVTIAAVRGCFPTLSLVRTRPPPSSAPCHQPPLVGARMGGGEHVGAGAAGHGGGSGGGACHLPLRKLASLMSLAVMAYVTRIGF